MSRSLSPQPKSPDSALGTMVDVTPDDESIKHDEEPVYLNSIQDPLMVIEKELSPITSQYKSEETIDAISECTVNANDLKNIIKIEVGNVSNEKDINVCGSNVSEDMIGTSFTEHADNNYHGISKQLLVCNYSSDEEEFSDFLPQNKSVKGKSKEFTDKKCVVQSDNDANEQLSRLNMVMEKETINLKCSDNILNRPTYNNSPTFIASLQINEQGVVGEVLQTSDSKVNDYNVSELQNYLTFQSQLPNSNELGDVSNNSLTNFMQSCDKNSATHEIKNFLTENYSISNTDKSNINHNLLSDSPFLLSCSPSSLQVNNPSIPEDLSECSYESGENISFIDSEVESVDELESDVVLSASMQFSLSKLETVTDSKELTSVDDIQETSTSVPVEIKHQKKAAQIEEPSETDCVSDIEDDLQETEYDISRSNCSSFNHISESYELPETVTKLATDSGSQVYLVGTAHFSKESQDDVSKTIRMVRPDIIVLELCKSRTAVLELDEETILNESKSLDLSKVRIILNQHGKVQGILYILLLSVSAHITKQLKMAPGGEFREAIQEARRTVPGCMIQLGDRPIQVTLSRALASLSVWQKAKLMWHIIASKGPISKEEVEKCKKKDFIEEMLAEMTGQFPGISEVFVKERDIFLTRSLQMAADPTIYQNFNRNRSSNSPVNSPRVVVGVVGIGHVSGIVDMWNKVTEEDIVAILEIPPPNLSDKILKFTIKYTFYGLIGFGLYKCLRPDFRSSIHSSIGSNITRVSDYITKYTGYGK